MASPCAFSPSSTAASWSESSPACAIPRNFYPTPESAACRNSICEHPFVFGNSMVRYEPAEEEIKLKGGNSNWRGPIWFPTTYLLVESLLKFDAAYGPESGLHGLAETIADRLIRIFKRDENGRRPVFGGSEKFQTDPHWRDCLLFYEHFHGDNGAGLGASHQTGWTALVANLIDEWRR